MLLINCVEALEGFASLGKEKLPMSVSYKIACVMQELKDVTAPFMEFRQEQINNLQSEYLGKEEEIPPAVMKDFQDEIKKLLDEEVDKDFTFVDLSSCDIEVSPQVVSMCLPFIKLAVDVDTSI